MAVFANIRNPTTNWTGGIPSFAMTEIEAAAFAANLFAAINGSTGGTYKPNLGLNIGGQGMFVTGPVFAWGIGALVSSEGGGSLFVQNGAVWPLLGIPASLAASLKAAGVPGISAKGHAGNLRTILTSCVEGTIQPWWAGHTTLEIAAIQLIAQSFIDASGAITIPTIHVPLRVHDGARMIRARLTVTPYANRVGGNTPIRMRVLACDRDGTSTPMTSVAAGADVNGWVSLGPLSASGAQTFTIPVDVANSIDISTYGYRAEIQDERGQTQSPWRRIVHAPVLAASTAYIDVTAAPGSIDGMTVTPASLDRILLGAPSSTPFYNGIWNVHAGTWTRASDSLNMATDLPPGSLVPVMFGDLHGSSCFQVAQQLYAPPALTAWRASAAYTGLDRVIPTGVAPGALYFVPSPGTSGASEPTWPVVLGGTVVDGTVTWLAIGNIGFALTQFMDESTYPVVADYSAYPGASPFMPPTFVGNLFNSIAVDFDSILDTRFQ